MNNVRKSGTAHALTAGAFAGVIASLVMGLYAMGAAWVDGVGFFTPLHHIASLVASQDAMMSSMEAAGGGSDFTVSGGTAVLGLLIHMATGAGYGALFGLVVSRLHLGRALMLVVGVVYGVLVFAFSAFAGLPLAAAILDSGDQITNMADMAGWATFVEHFLYGATLGLLLAKAHVTASTPKAAVATR